MEEFAKAKSATFRIHNDDGGGEGIRTLETLADLPAFQASALDHYATPPCGQRGRLYRRGYKKTIPTIRDGSFISRKNSYFISSSAVFLALRSCLSSVRSVEAAMRIFTKRFFSGSQSRLVMMLGRKRRLVARMDFERLCPVAGPFPVI